MTKKNKCEDCEKNAVIKDDGKVWCAECYMFNHNILPRIVRSSERRYKYKSINHNKTLH
jgi:protein-arginine kinase activator protein McsA